MGKDGMKKYGNVVISLLLGALIMSVMQKNEGNDFSLISPANAMSAQIGAVESKIDHCEMLFTDDRNFFETEINKRVKNVKVIQSNVIWSETTKQLGFYAMICY